MTGRHTIHTKTASGTRDDDKRSDGTMGDDGTPHTATACDSKQDDDKGVR